MPRLNDYDRTAIDELLSEQHGVITRRQLLALDMPAATLASRLRLRGPWQRLLPGVVLAQTGPPSQDQRLRGALLFAGERAVVTGGSALRSYGVRAAAKTAPVHVLVPHERRRGSQGYVVIERTRLLPEPVMLKGVPHTAVARATIDGCRRLEDLGVVRELVAEVVQRRLCRVSDLRNALGTAARQRTALPRHVVNEVGAGVRSGAEAVARESILGSGLVQPEWNVRVETAAGLWLGDPDAFWLALAAALQIDSMAWHLGPAAYRRTQALQRRYTNAGVLVLPYAPGDILDDTPRFLDDVAAFLLEAQRRTPPDNIVVRLRTAS